MMSPMDEMQRQELARYCAEIELTLVNVRVALADPIGDLGHADKHARALLMETAELATTVRRYHAAELLAGGRRANG